MVAAISIHGSGLLKKRNCPFRFVAGRAGKTGTHLRINQIVTPPHNAAITKTKRQDRKCPRKFPAGTPNKLATVIPIIIIATAEVLFPFSAKRLATIEPTPK